MELFEIDFLFKLRNNDKICLSRIYVKYLGNEQWKTSLSDYPPLSLNFVSVPNTATNAERKSCPKSFSVITNGRCGALS